VIDRTLKLAMADLHKRRDQIITALRAGTDPADAAFEA
jgi:hypothetical protein